MHNIGNANALFRHKSIDRDESESVAHHTAVKQQLGVLLLGLVHDEEEVDEPPHTTSATGEQLDDTETNVTDIHTVDAVAAKEY